VQGLGSSLFDVQKGNTPDNAKPFKGIGSGIFEIVTRFDKDINLIKSRYKQAIELEQEAK
jgi:hypothetical protein